MPMEMQKKIFMAKLNGKKGDAYIMYLHNYASELEDFADTFLKYLPFYVRNSDQLILTKEDYLNFDYIIGMDELNRKWMPIRLHVSRYS